jgi:hypothetical protein
MNKQKLLEMAVEMTKSHSLGGNSSHPDIALEKVFEKLLEITNKHAILDKE